MITAGCHVIIQKVGGEHIRVCDLKRKKSILIEKLRFYADGAIDQPFGLFEASKGKLSRVCVETPSTAEEQDNQEKCSTDAESKMETSSTEPNGSCLLSEEDTRNDAQKRQKLTQDEISAMKNTGINAQDLVAKLVDGSSTFSERSEYAKSKYIRRKARKHSDRVLILKPTIRLLTDSYYKKDPDRIANLRLDVLGQMLLLGGVRSGCKCIVLEQCLGLLTAAVMERLGGNGACIHVHRGLIAQGIPCVQSMGFDDKMYSTFLPLRAATLLNGRIEDSEDKAETTNQSEATLSRKADRLNRERLAWSLMSAQQVDIVFIAVKSIDPIDILEHTWPSLRLAATVVLYSPLSEPLMKAFTWLRERGALHVQMSDSFQRYYQVLNESTHPVMQQLVAGGLILSAIKVVPPS